MAFSSAGGTRKGSRYHRLDDIPTNTFTPRTYQIQLLDAALKRNTLLCLGCAQSKVFLALMVAKELSSATRLPSGHGHKCTFYLTDTEEEVESLCQTLPHHTDLLIEQCPATSKRVNIENGETSNELACWDQLMESSNILVCHGLVFLAALQKNYVRLKDINLLIFDDCHRSVEEENHSYAEIVTRVKSIPQNMQPRILGVTSSIAGIDCTDPSKLRHTIASMEHTMHSYAETSMLILSERFGCRPKESVVQCDSDECDDEQRLLQELLEDILEQNYYFFQHCNISIDADVDNRDPTEIPLQVLSQCLNILNILGSWCTSSISEYFVMQLEKIIKCEKNDIHKKFLRCVTTTLRGLTRAFEMNFHPDYDVDELLEYATPKVKELVKVLRDYKPEVDFMIISNGDNYDVDDDFSDLSEDDDDDSIVSGTDGEEEKGSSNKTPSSKPVHIAVKRTADGGHERIMTFTEEEEKNLCGIVFVENRYIAFGLNKVIEEVCSWDENLCFVKSCHITGQGLRGSSGKQKANRTYKRQEEALRKFRTQECNLVVATPELEEGIDIPKCNLVVRFDTPKDYRSYSLSKGRARARDAAYVILLDKEIHEQFSMNLKVFKGIEQVLLGERNCRKVLHDRVQDIDEGNESDDEDDDPDDFDEVIDDVDLLPPYCTLPNLPSSPQVTMQGAIALINRYCAKLPSDAFTHLTPQCRTEKLSCDPPKFVAYLRLPINSPIKEEMKGPEMKSKKLAKMAVALKMCGKLHQKGELDENLVPVGKEMFLYEEEEEWAEEEDLTGQARPGTTKRKQYYIKKTADALIQSLPNPGQPCYLYLINLRLTGPITDEQNTRGRVIYAPEDTVQTLGILLSKKIPQMPYFPVYTRSGEVTASVDLLRNGLVFTKEEIDRLLKFHHFVFSGVLHLEKDPMEFAPSKADCGCIVVPLNGIDQLEIEWDFVDRVIQFQMVEKRAGFSRRKPDEPFEFCIGEFKDAVVMPSYRNIDQPQHFYVAEIRHDLNPLSPFPSPELYKTFQDYYTTKYGLKITNTEQPLLDVDHTSARLNLLTPRYMNQKGVALPTSSAETKRARRENLQQKQILVPELCDVHVFPASLWRKTVCLPAILYRTNYLLLAEELRQKISRETGIGIEVLPEGFRFPQLDFGFETSPEKLKEAEVRKSGQHSSSDVKSISTGEKKELQKPENCRPTNKTNESLLLKEINCDHSIMTKTSEDKGIVPVADEATLGRDLKTTEEKVDSTASSDSDSGILSSGSDTNTGTSVGIPSRESPDLSSGIDTPPAESKTEQNCNRNDISTPAMPKSKETSSLGLNISPRCSNHDIVCNTTPQGSSVPSSCEGDHNQCNIYTTEVAKPPSTSCVTGQLVGSSSRIVSTSSVIKCDCNPCKHTSSATATSSLTTGITSPSSSTDSLFIASTCGAHHLQCTFAISVSTAASVMITTQCSDHNNLISAAHSYAGAKYDAATLLPSSSSSASSLSLSSTSLASFSSLPVTPQSSDSSPGPPDTPRDVTTPKDVASKENINVLSSPHASILSSSLSAHSMKTSSYGKFSNCASTPSPAASTEASDPVEITANTCNSRAELHDNQGCELLMGQFDSNTALLKETHPTEDETKICDIYTNIEPFSQHVNFISDSKTLSCVHQLSGQNITNEILVPSTQEEPVTFEQPCETNKKEQISGKNERGNFSLSYVDKTSTCEQLLSNIQCNEVFTSQEVMNLEEVSSQITESSEPVSTATFSLTSPPQPPSTAAENQVEDDPAIIMNKLGQELIGLDIDLIIPLADTSDTFHPSKSQWGPSSHEKQNYKKSSSWEGTGLEESECHEESNTTQCSSDDKKDSSRKDSLNGWQSPENYHTTDADVIKFSFATDDMEKKGGNKKEFTTEFGTWISKAATENEQAENKPESVKCKQPSHSTSTVKTSVISGVEMKDEFPSLSDNEKILSSSPSTDFDIGVWNSRKNRSDGLKHEESSLSDRNAAVIRPSESVYATTASSASFSSSLNSWQNVSLDEDRDLKTFVGPSPCLIMQALTMSNANDFFSLERLETIGDSFLKYAITVYLYCSYPGIHEGKLSYLRSKQVSNCNLYRLGRRKCLAECMVSTKFEPYENWLPPGFIINEDRRRGPVPKVVIVTPGSKVTNTSRNFYLDESSDSGKRDEVSQFNKELEWIQQSQEADQLDDLDEPNHMTLTPYSLQLHHGLPDKSVADCVEALIGCYLTTCGRKAALMFMSWLGLKVLPKKKKESSDGGGYGDTTDKTCFWKLSEQEFDELRCPPSPMFSPTPENMTKLNQLLQGFDSLEEKICYRFRDRSYLLQAFTHASYHYNTITDCYQRVEFLGDAILDYVITRHLYEDSQKYSPGILTDLRSALVNNNIFAALAVKWGFHKYFKAISPSLFHVIDKFVKRQKEKNQDDIDIDEEYQELSMDDGEPEDAGEEDDEEEEVEMEIPKALGDIFESVAGAIYLDSGMSLDTVWRVYYRMMKPHIDKYLKSIPKSPVRELLETEPETAKFERPERTMNGKVRVTVNVVGKGVFSGVGRNYRIAKSAAAKKALRSIRIMTQNLMG